ncbi:MAG: hydrogenase maturation nickel metallochaperone HypA [Lentisphaerae bacterium]|nr:hydrogenase maturation nickel metallochaperone HypA [Lentisphaerota bacterium]
MHEFAICQNIVAAAEVEYARVSPPPRRLLRLRVVAGGLHQIVPEYLTQAYVVLTSDSPLAGSALELAILPVKAQCRRCAWTGQIELPIFQCGACDSFEVDVIQGKELRLESLEVDTP